MGDSRESVPLSSSIDIKDDTKSNSPKAEAAGSLDSNGESSILMNKSLDSSLTAFPFERPAGGNEELTVADLEREIMVLETQIRAQKESSMNAKTAITFDQLRKIHYIGKLLGPSKDAFYDRICRAADIQRASLKNRLKQNKEKFKPKSDMNSGGVSSLLRTIVPSTNSSSEQMQLDSLQNGLFNTNLFGNVFNSDSPDPSGLGSMSRSGASVMGASTTATLTLDVSPPHDEKAKIPANRMLELLQLGFSFDELKQVNELYHFYHEMATQQSLPSQSIREQFSNFLSTNASECLRLVSAAFNMLEMGYGVSTIAPIIHTQVPPSPLLTPLPLLMAQRRKRQAEDSPEEGAEVKRERPGDSADKTLPLITEQPKSS